MRLRFSASLLSALVLASGPAAAADAVYKYVDANGRMVYTDDPKGAPGAERVPLELLSVVPAAPATASRAAELIDAANRRAAALDSAQADMITASRALEHAQEMQQLGIEPLEGERIGRRFRDEYWQRQALLEAQVQNALALLDNAIARRNENR